MMHLRAAEWINLLVFSSYTMLAWRRRSLDGERRAKAVLIGAAGLAITICAALFPSRLLSPLAASVTRDWIPYLLLLMFYWQAGQFVTRADTAFEARLEYWDRRLVSPWVEWCIAHPLGTWILGYLGEGAADHFWTVVLLATYPSYGMLPFLQTRPPRALGEKWSAGLPSGRIRAFNLGILQHASIHANTFPSGHVASSVGCALILLRLGPTWIGLLFLCVALSISLGAVVGRYHYLADAIAAIIVASVVFATETVFATHLAVSSLISSLVHWW